MIAFYTINAFSAEIFKFSADIPLYISAVPSAHYDFYTKYFFNSLMRDSLLSLNHSLGLKMSIWCHSGSENVYITSFLHNV